MRAATYSPRHCDLVPERRQHALRHDRVSFWLAIFVAGIVYSVMKAVLRLGESRLDSLPPGGRCGHPNANNVKTSPGLAGQVAIAWLYVGNTMELLAPVREVNRV